MAAIAKLKLLASRKAADRPSDIAPPALVAADEDEDDLPIPSDVKVVFLSDAGRLVMWQPRSSSLPLAGESHQR
jgi:hypothetical protein